MKLRATFFLLIFSFLLQVFLPQLETFSPWTKEASVNSFHFNGSPIVPILNEFSEEDEEEAFSAISAGVIFILFLSILLSIPKISKYCSYKSVPYSDSLLYRICVLRV